MSRPESGLPEEIRALMPMTPAVFYTLFALAREEQHGYAIMQAVDTLSERTVSMGPGTLYLTIGRLVNLGLVEETTQNKRPDQLERRRRYYRITRLGRRAFELEVERMRGVLRRVRTKGLYPAEQEGQ
jgi:DNA-binding PadR family transcriptional regulator